MLVHVYYAIDIVLYSIVLCIVMCEHTNIIVVLLTYVLQYHFLVMTRPKTLK